MNFSPFWGEDADLDRVHMIFDLGGTLQVMRDDRRFPGTYSPGCWEGYVAEMEGASEVVAMAVHCFGANRVHVLSRAGRHSAIGIAYWYTHSDWLTRTGLHPGHLYFVPNQRAELLDLPAFCGRDLRTSWMGKNKKDAINDLRRNHPGAVFIAVDDRVDQLEAIGPRWGFLMPAAHLQGSPNVFV